MAIDSPGNITSGVGLFNWINGITDNWFFPGMIIAIYLITLIKMVTNPANTASKSFAAASFVAMVISIFARVIDLVDTTFMSIFIILTALGGVWMHIENTG